MSVGNNPQLPGVGAIDTVIVSEKMQQIGMIGCNFCFQKCVTHFAEESIPYHPGEKSCQDRCLAKIIDGYEIAKQVRQDLEMKIRAGKPVAKWMEELTR